MSLQQNHGRLLGLEASRGIAAILVVFFHAAVIMNLPKYYEATPLNGFFGFGYAGVDFFFVLSGFIILYVHYADIGRRQKLLPYFTKRFIRIYPLHWIVTAIFIAGLLIYPMREFPDLDKVVRSLFLIPQDGYPLGVVAWTLIHEVSFYLLFGLLIASRLFGSLVLLLWFISVLFGAIYIQDDAGYLQKFLFSAHNLEFLLGMGVALLVCRWDIHSFWRLAGYVGVVIFALAAWLNNDGTIAPNFLLSLYAIGSALIIYALVSGDLMGELKQPGRWLVFFGSASYSIYLIHFLALSVFIKVFLKIGADQWLPLTINYLGLVLLSVLTGSLLHLYIEKPLLKLCRSKLLPVR